MKKGARPFRVRENRSRAGSVAHIIELLTPRSLTSVQTLDSCSEESHLHVEQTDDSSAKDAQSDDEDMDEVFRRYSESSLQKAARTATCFRLLPSTSEHSLVDTESYAESAIPDIRKQLPSPEVRRILHNSQPKHKYLPFCTEYDGRTVYRSKPISGCIRDLVDSIKADLSGRLDDNIASNENVTDTDFLKAVPWSPMQYSADDDRSSQSPNWHCRTIDHFLSEKCPFGVLNISMKYLPYMKRLRVHVERLDKILESKIYHKGFGLYVKMCRMPRYGAKQAKTLVSHHFVKEDSVVVNDRLYICELEQEDVESLAIRFQVCQKGVAVNKCLKYLGEALIWMDEYTTRELLGLVVIREKLESYYG